MPKSQPTNNKIAVGFAIFVLVIGLALGAFGMWFTVEANRARTWPKVPGTIVSVTIKSSRGGSGTSRRYFTEVRYRYSVDGSSFTSDRYRLGDGSNTGSFSTRDDALANSKWVQGNTIDVYYNPDEPDSSVLVPEASWGVCVPGVLGVFFVLVGGFLLVSFRQERSSNNR